MAKAQLSVLRNEGAFDDFFADFDDAQLKVK